jgi:hypothetical protein
MILTIRACAPPQDNKPALPKRMARARRVMESKRMDTFREVHDSLKKTAKSEQEFLKDFFDKARDMWKVEEEEEE